MSFDIFESSYITTKWVVYPLYLADLTGFIS